MLGIHPAATEHGDGSNISSSECSDGFTQALQKLQARLLNRSEADVPHHYIAQRSQREVQLACTKSSVPQGRYQHSLHLLWMLQEANNAHLQQMEAVCKVDAPMKGNHIPRQQAHAVHASRPEVYTEEEPGAQGGLKRNANAEHVQPGMRKSVPGTAGA